METLAPEFTAIAVTTDSESEAESEDPHVSCEELPVQDAVRDTNTVFELIVPSLNHATADLVALHSKLDVWLGSMDICCANIDFKAGEGTVVVLSVPAADHQKLCTVGDDDIAKAVERWQSCTMHTRELPSTFFL